MRRLGLQAYVDFNYVLDGSNNAAFREKVTLSRAARFSSLEGRFASSASASCSPRGRSSFASRFLVAFSSNPGDEAQ